MMSVQGSRHLRTQSSEMLLSYRDIAKLPTPVNNRFKRTYLKGASNRVKSLKEEQQYAKLWSEKRAVQAPRAQDQLLRIRNLHLKRLEPLQGEIEQISQGTQVMPQTCHAVVESQLEVGKNEDNQLVQVSYHATPVVRKLKRNDGLMGQHSIQQQALKTRTSCHSPKQKTEQFGKSSQADLLAMSIQFTTYGSLKMRTQQSKSQTIQKLNVPTTLDGAKKYLKQYI